MRIEIIKLVPFDIERVTNENTSPCLRRKFYSGLSNGGSKTQASKNFEMCVDRWFMKQKFKMCFMSKNFRGQSVD